MADLCPICRKKMIHFYRDFTSRSLPIIHAIVSWCGCGYHGLEPISAKDQMEELMKIWRDKNGQS